MKVFKNFLLIFLGIILGVGGTVGFYFLTMGDIAWQEYLETKLIPNAVIVISAVGTLCVAALPIINKVQLALDKFGKATDDIDTTVKSGKRTDDAIYEQNEKIASFKGELDDIKALVGDTKEMVRIGMCHTKELVINGYAAEIAKVGNHDEQQD